MEDHRIRTSIIKPGETIITICPSINAGTIGPIFGGKINNAFGLCLVKNPLGDYILIVYMKLQFFFENNGNLAWNNSDKTKFIQKFESAISQKWGDMRVIKSLSQGKRVFLDFRFLSVYDQWSIGEHWEIYIQKIKKGGFEQSYVNSFFGTTHLDSEDLRPSLKSDNIYQRGAVHEFGHMLGLNDEYITSSKHVDDLHSIMNSGEITRIRHHSSYIKWLNEILKEKGIK
ncbi:hypothetical protein [Tenacibaculum larymnensis]|uniref:Uncharacterized protein n=1 Tax=Tenacibaculum larymnensis TaxID=2878201 RepID=A0A9X4EXT8_9FLAO|nr:hypothetical protein [Tenacibaculum larymnensis]MDE1208366.1 hypothetical protein [Tenacibaculum larymnensis]